MWKLPLAVVLGVLAMVGTAQPALQWDIYEDATIDEVGDFYSLIRIYDTPPEHTTAVMVGGRVDQMRTYDAVTLVATGGHISSFGAFDSSTVNISGEAEIGGLAGYAWSTVSISGQAKIGRVAGYAWSTVNIISGGDPHYAELFDHATLNLSGGSLSAVVVGPDCVLNTSGSATVELMRVGGLANVNGGNIAKSVLGGMAVLNLHGGEISDGIFEADWRRGVLTEFTGAVNVYGYDLVKTDTGGEYGFGQVYGTYLDDSPFLIDLGEGVYPHVNLVPEPATILILGLGGAIHRYCEHSTRTHARTGGDVC